MGLNSGFLTFGSWNLLVELVFREIWDYDAQPDLKYYSMFLLYQCFANCKPGFGG